MAQGAGAYLGPTADLRAGSLSASATATNNADAEASLVGVGAVTGAGARVRGLTAHNTSAYEATGANASITNGATFTATGTNTATASGDSITVSLGGGSFVDVETDAGGTTEAYVAGTLGAATLDLTATSTNGAAVRARSG